MGLLHAAQRAARREWISRARSELAKPWSLARLALSFFFMAMLMLNFIVFTYGHTPPVTQVIARWFRGIF